jgi:hypothetical protein
MANMSCKTPHLKVFEKSQLPKRHHYANNKRIDDIIVDVEDKWLFTFRFVVERNLIEAYNLFKMNKSVCINKQVKYS